MTLTVKDLEDDMPDYCPILCIAMGKSTNGKPACFSRSVDQIEAKGGYTAANTLIMSYFANIVKGEFSSAELFEFPLLRAFAMQLQMVIDKKTQACY
jgi:hypothetical protein